MHDDLRLFRQNAAGVNPGGHYSHAVAAGGFMGFGLGAMPVGLTVMQRITLQHGAAPRAFLVVTLAASLVQDLINAGAVQAALAWAAR